MDILEALGCWGVFFGFVAVLLLIGWVGKVVSQFCETIKYRRKLDKLIEEIAPLDIEALSERTDALQKSQTLLEDLLCRKYGHGRRRQFVKGISEYLEAEAEHQRSSRRKPKRPEAYRYRTSRPRYRGRS